VRQNIVNETAEARSARNARLETAEQGMGLTMPGGGVQAPTLGFDLDPFQIQALDELGRNTVSPNNATDGRVTPRGNGRVTPRKGGTSAFTPLPATGPANHATVEAGILGINPPVPHLPGHDFGIPRAAAAGVNLGIRSTDFATSRQQSFIAAGSVGERVVYPAGTRSRNPDQVDVLHLMNQQMNQGIAHLNSMMPSQDDRQMAQLEGAILSALSRMAQYTSLGLDTSAMSLRVSVLEKELNALLDSMFKL